MNIKKAFRIKSEILNIDDFALVINTLDLTKQDLIFTEKRIFDNYLNGKIKEARILFIDDFKLKRGPNSDELINNIVKAAGAQFSRVIGIGGGAILDLAKLLALESATPVKQLLSQNIKLRKARNLVLIPTTPGTGSEVTQFCAIYIPDIGAQLIVDDEELCADTAILCPQLLNGIPLKVLAASSFDAFVHAFESYLSPLATPFSQTIAKEAMNLLLNSWNEITGGGVIHIENNYEKLLTAGTMAGISYANAGCAAIHALAYPLSARLHIPHGEANYLVFNEVLKIYSAKSCDKKLDEIRNIIASALNCSPENAFIKITNLCESLIERQKLSAYGMQEDQILEFTDMVLTRQHMLIANGYVQLTVGEIAQIYKNLL